MISKILKRYSQDEVNLMTVGKYVSSSTLNLCCNTASEVKRLHSRELHKHVNSRNGLQFNIKSLVVKLAWQEKQAHIKNLQVAPKILRNQEDIH